MLFKITILGTSSALPTSRSFPSAQVINIYGIHSLIDCGEGTQIQLRRFHVNFGRIKYIFISHLHGDHYFGLYGLLSTYELMHRQMPLHIYAPAELEQFFLSSCSPIQIDQLPYQVQFHALPSGGGLILKEKNFSVYAFELNHRVPTWGFVFRENQRPPNIIKEKIVQLGLGVEHIKILKSGQSIVVNGREIKPEDVTLPPPKQRSYAYVSDTKFFPDIVPWIRAVDVLYHEATFDNAHEQKAAETFHSTAEQAAQIALMAEVGKLVIGHYSATIQDLEQLLAEAKAVFPSTELAFDGKMIDLPFVSSRKSVDS